MDIRQKILDAIYKYNTSAYGASSECVDVVYEDDYDDLNEDLVKLFFIYAVSNQRELLIGYIMNEQRLYCGKPDRELSEQLVDDYIANL